MQKIEGRLKCASLVSKPDLIPEASFDSLAAFTWIDLVTQEEVMEGYLQQNFGVKPNQSSVEALEKWRQLCEVVKNPKRRFRFVANLTKRREAAALRETNQEKLKVAALVSKAARQFLVDVAHASDVQNDQIQPLLESDEAVLEIEPGSNVDHRTQVQNDEAGPMVESHDCVLQMERSSNINHGTQVQNDEDRPMVESHDCVLQMEPSSNVNHRTQVQNGETQSMAESDELALEIEWDSNVDHRTEGGKNGWNQKVLLEWIFVIINFILELPSAVLDQLSSEHKPRYALFVMLISFATLFICIVELIYKGRKEKVCCRRSSMLPWFYYPSEDHKPFGSFKDMFGSVCAFCQCIVTAVNYSQSDRPIKISVWPIVFAFGVLCSKILENPERRAIS